MTPLTATTQPGTALRTIQLPMGRSIGFPNSVEQGGWVYKFDCTIWSNELQRSLPIIIKVRVASLPALNHALRDAGMGNWCVTYWKLID